MKKSTIGIVIVSFLLIIIGGGLFIGGTLAVGGIEVAKDALAKHGVYIDHGFQIDIDRGSRPMKYSDMEPMYFNAEDVRNLKLEMGKAEVEIVENASAKQISVETDGNYDIYVENGVLHIEIAKGLDEHFMRIEIPSNAVFESVEISAGACVADIQYLETREFAAEVGAGQVNIKDLQADSAEFEIGVGEIIVDYASVQECDINVGMGNFEYHGIIENHVGIECGMGNAEVYLKASEEDYNYEIDCAAGNVSIGDESFGGLASERKINNHAEATIDIECGMGNVTIEF